MLSWVVMALVALSTFRPCAPGRISYRRHQRHGRHVPAKDEAISHRLAARSALRQRRRRDGEIVVKLATLISPKRVLRYARLTSCVALTSRKLMMNIL